MKMSGGPATVQIKIVLLAIALIIAVATFVYTHTLVTKLEKRERQIVELYATSLQYVADPSSSNADFTFLLDVIKRIDFPLILTDENNNVLLDGMGGGIRNLEIDSTWDRNQLKNFLDNKINEFNETNEAIPVMSQDSVIINKIYFGDSDLIKGLRYYPYLQIVFAIIFIIIAYVSFSYLKKHEQSNIWVGMSKETAHQLGTPISSLMGWNEILKINLNNPDKVIDVSEEIDNDLQRLNKITQRFSKIGSKPKLKENNVANVISQVIEYFNKRLPHSGKRVEISIIGQETCTVPLNVDLFEWVIENLIKNSLDAIGNNKGEIIFNLIEEDKNLIIEISDNGKGIDLKRRKDIFRPGYSTKRRGWGLGLSLTKRIIENYHKGKIFVKNSVINEGTTFQITMSKAKS